MAAEAYNQEANQLYISGDKEGAYDKYSLAIGADPKVAKFHSNRAQALLDLGKFQLALQDAENAIALEPGNAKHLYRSAKAYFGTGDYNAAMAQGHAMRALNPSCPNAASIITNCATELAKHAQGAVSSSSVNPSAGSPTQQRLRVWIDVDMDCFGEHLSKLCDNTSYACRTFNDLNRELQKQGHEVPDVFVAYVMELNEQMPSIAYQYIQRGGTFVLLGDFGKHFFPRLGVPWEVKNYFRTQSSVTPNGAQFLGPTVANVRYSSKSVWLTSVPAHQAITMTTVESKPQSLVPGFIQESELAQPLCNMAVSVPSDPQATDGGCSAGWFVFSGDINLEKTSIQLLLEILKKRAADTGKRVGPRTAQDPVPSSRQRTGWQ